MSGAELKAKGNEFFKKGQYEEAISWYSKAIEVEPDNHTYYSNRSAARLGLKDYKGAIEDGQNCIRCKKDWNKGYFRLANAQMKSGDFLGAYNTVNKGLVIVANDKDLLAIRSQTEAKAKMQEKAQRSELPRNEQLKAMGNDAFKQSRFDDAITFYQQAIDASENGEKVWIDSYNNMAGCHQQMGNHSAVCEACSMVLEYDENNQKALLRRGLAFEALDRYQLGLADIRKLIYLNPKIEMANKAQHRLGQAVRDSRKMKAEIEKNRRK